MKLLLWLRENKRSQLELASAVNRSEAWVSKRLRGHQEVTTEDRELIRHGCSALLGRRVSMSDLFESEAA